MSEPTVDGLRSIEFWVPDLKTTARFYDECWKIEPIEQRQDAHYFRATGTEHHCVVLHEGATAGVKKVNFSAKDRDTVNSIHQKLVGLGIKIVAPPHKLTTPGAGFGFSFQDPDGLEYGISSDVARHSDGSMQDDRPFKLSHVVSNSAKVPEQSEWFADALGFKISDRTEIMHFVRCSADHHSIAIARADGPGLNHTAFEMPNFNALMTGVGRMQHKGFEIDWGVGRHGPGNNIFSYFREPNGLIVEYTAEVDQVDDSYPTGTPEQWTERRKKNDMWGTARAPSPLMRRCMHGDLTPPKVQF